MCNVQVMFFVGVQLDITVPSTPTKSEMRTAQSRFGFTDSSASRHASNVTIEDGKSSHEAQRHDVSVSPAAHQQVQSQVCLVSCYDLTILMPAAAAFSTCNSLSHSSTPIPAMHKSRQKCCQQCVHVLCFKTRDFTAS